MTGRIGNVVLDASSRAEKFRRSAIAAVALLPAVAHLHFGAAHEESRVRTLPRLQRDPDARLDPSHRPHVFFASYGVQL